jgi:prepilin-type N-terminal cleavage/methylation domain-containing protein
MSSVWKSRVVGFTLLEMSVVLIIITVIVAGGMAMFTGSLQKRQLAETQVKLKAIQQALYSFRLANSRIPCPADVTLAVTDTNFGVEGATLGTCTGGSPAANFSTGNNVEGMVPTVTLGLPDEYAFDGWGRRLMYAADARFTATNAFITYSINTAGAMQINFASGAYTAPLNVALASNGGTAIGSSTYLSYFASYAIDGDRLGQSGAWVPNFGYPAWLEIDFSSSQAVNEIDVFTAQDNFAHPSTPTLAMTFTLYGMQNFLVQYWDGAAWQVVPGGTVTNNNHVWTQFSFSPISTTKVRVYVTKTVDGYTRIWEMEAYTTQNLGPAPVYALVSLGPNGHGAYPRGSTANLNLVTSRINAGSNNVDEQNNCDCSTSAATTGLDGVFVQKAWGPTSGHEADPRYSFDDVVVFGTRADLAAPTE